MTGAAKEWWPYSGTALMLVTKLLNILTFRSHLKERPTVLLEGIPYLLRPPVVGWDWGPVIHTRPWVHNTVGGISSAQ